MSRIPIWNNTLKLKAAQSQKISKNESHYEDVLKYLNE